MPEITAEQPHDMVADRSRCDPAGGPDADLAGGRGGVTATVAPAETVVPEEKPEIREPKKEKVKSLNRRKSPEGKEKVTRKKTGDEGEQAQSQVKGKADGVGDCQFQCGIRQTAR